MASLLEKVSTLISANLHYMVDQALKTNSMAVIDQYIRQVEENLEDLEAAAATVGGEAKSIQRRLNDNERKLQELDRAIDAQGLAPRARIMGFRSLSRSAPPEPGQQTAERPRARFK